MPSKARQTHKHLTARTIQGNTLALSMVFFLLVMIIAYFALNYTGLLGTHKQAQTAGDAAALEAAKQISLISAPSDLGEIGIVDISGNDPTNPLKKVNPSSEVPITGFNTALATIRLDLLIAEDLNNSDMKDLALRDLATLKKASGDLAKKITDSLGQNGAVWTKVANTYKENNRRLGGPGTLIENTLVITPGRLTTGQGSTNVAIPTPPDAAAVLQNSGGYYKPQVNIPAWGANFVFAAVGKEPVLVDNNQFIAYGAADYSIAGFGSLPPTVVRVEADNKIIGLAPEPPGKKKHDSVLHSASSAQAGGARTSQRSTAYTVGFAGSLPSQTTFPTLNIKALLDFKGWQTPGQTGTWLQASSGEFPGNIPDEIEYLSGKGKVQSPSTALAYGLYNWLRSLGLRPNRDSIKQALASAKGDFRTITTSRSFGFDDGNDPESGSEADEDNWYPDDSNNNNSESDAPILGCMIPDDDEGDTNYEALKNNTQEGQDLYYDSFNYNSASDSCPDSGIAILVDPVTGTATPPAGNSITELCQFMEGIIATNRAAISNLLAAKQVLDETRAAQSHLKDTANTLKKADAVDANKPGGQALLAQELNTLKQNILDYMAYPALQADKSPPSSGVLSTFNSFTAESISAANAETIRSRYSNALNSAINKVETPRVYEMEDRGIRVARSAKQAGQRTYAIMRSLKKYSSKGIRRLDGTDLFPDNPVFASKIRSRGPRVNFVMPNNEPDIIRNGAGARPNFFNLDYPEDAQIAALVKSIIRVGYDGSGSFVEAKLGSGSTKMPTDKSFAKDERWNWDTGPKNNGKGGTDKRIGFYANRLYKKSNVEGGDPSVNYQAIKDLKKEVKQNYNSNNIDGTEDLPKSTVPGFEQVFLLTCEGDASLKSGGTVSIANVANPRDSQPRYPFSSNKVLENQVLYYSGGGFKDGNDGANPDVAPTSTYRSVIARDQFSNLKSGESFRLQQPTDWCHNSYGITIGKSSEGCPYPAGEWRMGNPYSIGCCHSRGGTGGSKKEQRDRWTVRIKGLPTGDPDVSLDIPDYEELDVCPRAIKLRGLRLHLRH